MGRGEESSMRLLQPAVERLHRRGCGCSAAELLLSDISRRRSARMSEGIDNQIPRRVPQSEDEKNPNYRKAFHLMTRETPQLSNSQLLMEGCFVSPPSGPNVLITSSRRHVTKLMRKNSSLSKFTARTFAFDRNND